MVVLRLCIRLFYTVSKLKFKQFFFRIYYKTPVFFKLSEPKSVAQRLWSNKWELQAWRHSYITGDNIFCFLGVSGLLKDPEDWNCSKKSKLWLYNLHYLDELNTLGAESKAVQLDDLVYRWISDNKHQSGNGWEPYPLSLRIVNLVKWYSTNEKSDDFFLRSIQQQSLFLSRKVEYHILGNHIFANGKALLFAGALLKDETGNALFNQGLRILDDQVREQFLDDGGHFELSPMYHASLMWDLCDLIQLCQISDISDLKLREKFWKRVLVRGLFWLEAMIHPDGRIPFFNDATFNISPEYKDLVSYANYLGITDIFNQPQSIVKFIANHLSDSGYVSISLNESSKVLIDVAKVGPDYQPGHAHADTLSFELSVFKQRVLVNSGISQYGNDFERLAQRSTFTHNTVVVNGKNSSDVWGGFRVGKRASPVDLIMNSSQSQISVSCSHNGYTDFFSHAIHHNRRWTVRHNSVYVEDYILGDYKVAEAFYYLHPDLNIEQSTEHCYLLVFPNKENVTISFSPNCSVQILNSFWHPEFGASIPNHYFCINIIGGKLTTTLSW